MAGQTRERVHLPDVMTPAGSERTLLDRLAARPLNEY